MSASNEFETNLQKLIFNNTALANVGDTGGLQPSAAAGNLYVSLHTADPGEAGDQTTSECAYTSYARVAVARSAAGWTVSGGTASNAATVTWPQCSGGSETATYFGIGTDSTGAGHLLFSGPLSSSFAISNAITPRAAAGELTVPCD